MGSENYKRCGHAIAKDAPASEKRKGSCPECRRAFIASKEGREWMTDQARELLKKENIAEPMAPDDGSIDQVKAVLRRWRGLWRQAQTEEHRDQLRLLFRVRQYPEETKLCDWWLDRKNLSNDEILKEVTQIRSVTNGHPVEEKGE
jgi:hypothetical protein